MYKNMSNDLKNKDSSSIPPLGGGGAGYFKEIFRAIKSLLVGMRRTGYYFTHHKEIITQEYPDNRDTLNLPERFCNISLSSSKNLNPWLLIQTSRHKRSTCCIPYKARPRTYFESRTFPLAPLYNITTRTYISFNTVTTTCRSHNIHEEFLDMAQRGAIHQSRFFF